MKNKKLLYALAGVVGCAVLVVVFVFAKNGGNLTGSLINVSPVAKLNQSVLKLDQSGLKLDQSPLKIVNTMIGANSVTLSVNNANLSSPYMYSAYCFNPKNEFGDFGFAYIAQPKIQSGQTVNIKVDSLRSSTAAYRCNAAVALQTNNGGYEMTKLSPQVDVTITK